MSKITEGRLKASQLKREEKSAQLAKTRLRGKGITSGSRYLKRGSGRSAYGSNLNAEE